MDHTSSSRSDRLLGLFAFSPSPPSSATESAATGGDELNEAELFYAVGDTSKSENHRSSSFSSPANTNLHWTFHQNSGILAALPESDYLPILRRKPSPTTTSMAIPSIPRLNGDGYFSQSVPSAGGSGRRFQQSAPVRIPVVPMKARRNAGDLAAVDGGDEDGDDDEMLPPHEIVARSSGVLPNATSFSVLEGVGRTLKGRDLRQVRNAIWRKTGFLD